MPTQTSPLPEAGVSGRSRRWSGRDLALIAAFAALTAVLAIAPPFYLPGNPVPIVLQTLGVMLSGAILGWRRGAAAMALMLGVGMLGVPVLSGGRPVLPALGGPTVGFLVGYVVGAGVVGALVQTRLPKVSALWVALSCVAGGIFAAYLCGIPGMAWRGGVSWQAAAAASVAFLPGDIVKVLIASLVAPAVHRAVPGLTPPLRRRV